MGKAERIILVVCAIVGSVGSAVGGYYAMASYYGWRQAQLTPSTDSAITASVSIWPMVIWGFFAVLFLAGTLIIVGYGVKKDAWLFQWPWGMISLEQASRKLQKELYRIGFNEDNCGATINDINVLALHISQVVDIYGKRKPFAPFEKINEWTKGSINNEGTIFYYYGNGKEHPKFIELSIKKSDYKKAIRRIMSYWK